MKEAAGLWRNGRVDPSQTADRQAFEQGVGQTLGQNLGQGFDLHEVDGGYDRRRWKLHASSAGLGWRNLFVSSQTEVPEEAEYGTTRHHLLVVHRNGPANVSLKMGGRTAVKRVAAGGATLVPGGGEGFTVRVLDSIDSVHIYLRHDMMERIFEERSAPARAPEPFFGLHDSLLEQLALASVTALDEPSKSAAFYVDHLAWAMGAHLVEIQDRSGSVSSAMHDGLTDRQLKQVKQYMFDHLGGDLVVEDLAAAAGLSPVYFARQFKLRTGSSPHRYLRSLRVKRAKELLGDDNMSIAEIALNCGFCHQEHMTRVFRAEFGTTPAVFRRGTQ